MARRRRPPRAGAINDLSPVKIFAQIVALQAIYYVVGISLILFTTLVAGKEFGFSLIFDWKSLRGDTTIGWTLGLCWMLDSLVGVIAMLLIIARSKLVLDFALTIHFINFLITSFYTRSVPTNTLWWALQLASAALMVFLGIWTCQWRELRPMAFGALIGKGTDDSNITRPKKTPRLPQGEDEETGGAFSRLVDRLGPGRGKVDGAGDYEMVDMEEGDEHV